LLQIIYISNAAFSFSEKDLEELLVQSRDYNNSKKITGLLIYHHESFVQLIEGPKKEISKLYSKIENDSRHYSLTIVHEEQIEKKEFSNWSMGFVDSRNIKQPVEGFVDFKSELDKLINDGTKAKRILNVFYELENNQL